jgi:hypothetical protein
MNVYDNAREYAAQAEQQALDQVAGMDLETLRREYVSMAGMVAYYTKIEREMTKPRLHLEAIKELLVKIKAEELIRQANEAEEQGVSLGIARVPAKPLIELVDRLQQITS